MQTTTLLTVLFYLLCLQPKILIANEQNKAQPPLSKVTQEAVERFSQLDYEVGYYGNTASEGLVQCSRAQDAWLAFLHDAEDNEEYLRGMEILNRRAQSFRSFCLYVTEVVNFYSPGVPRTMWPQTFEMEIDGQIYTAFLNTYKSGKELTAEEREAYFDQEFADYWRDRFFDPFILDENTLQEIEPETLYNFALLPDGTISAALERPGLKDYHLSNDNFMVETFAYPNHTILAGSAHQPVLTAGAFILFQSGEKRLFFVSNKSGHYQPTYLSLDTMRKQLGKYGVNVNTVILVPDVDLAHAAIKTYDKVQIPISICQNDAKKLFGYAYNRWKETYHSIDRHVLKTLANGNLSILNRQVIDKLNNCREESTYMRSAYHLFTAEHEAPEVFHKFVKHFGLLKDAIKHGVPHRIRSSAMKVIKIMDLHEEVLLNRSVNYTEDEDFFTFINQQCHEVKQLLAAEELPINEYHMVKKAAREFGTLFLLLAQDAQWKGNGHFLYRAASGGFFQMNEVLSGAHDAHVGSVLRDETTDEGAFATIPLQAKNTLIRYIDHFAINPPSAEIQIHPDSAFWLINEAKWWYSAHAHIAHHPESDENDNFDPRPKRLLEQIIKGEYTGLSPDHQAALRCLIDLRGFAVRARNALLLLDISHKVPSDIHNYIHALNEVINALQTNSTDDVREEAQVLYEYLSYKGTPTLALETWECTDQASFNATMDKYLGQVKKLNENDQLSNEEFSEIAEHIRAIGDLMDLFRRGGLRHQTLPTVYYDLLAEHCNALVAQLTRDNADGHVTHEMKDHARFILKKIATS